VTQCGELACQLLPSAQLGRPCWAGATFSSSTVLQEHAAEEAYIQATQ